MTRLSHPDPLVSALRLSYFTLAWNGVVGTFGLVVALQTGSLALAGLALNALLDSSASGILVWRFLHERRDPLVAERVERQSLLAVSTAMVLVGVYVIVQAVRAFVGGSHPDETAVGFAIATASVLVLPWLGTLKLRIAALVPSAALRGDGILTLAGATLAAITLVALLIVSTAGWWWADPAAALVVSIGLICEGLRVAVRHRFG